MPADDNPLLDILLARGINGESPVKSPAHRGTSDAKSRRKSTINGSPQIEGRAEHSKAKPPKARGKSKVAEPKVSKKASKGKKPAKSGDSEENDQPVAGAPHWDAYTQKY